MSLAASAHAMKRNNFGASGGGRNVVVLWLISNQCTVASDIRSISVEKPPIATGR